MLEDIKRLRALLEDGQWHYKLDLRKALGVCGECQRPYADDAYLKMLLNVMSDVETGHRQRVRLV